MRTWSVSGTAFALWTRSSSLSMRTRTSIALRSVLTWIGHAAVIGESADLREPKIGRPADGKIALPADDADASASYLRVGRNRKEIRMPKARIGLILTGLVFGIWEAVDIFQIDAPAVAAVFAALFLA